MDTGVNEKMTIPSQPNNDSKDLRNRRIAVIAISVLGIIAVILLIVGFIFLLNPELTSSLTVARVRDVFIILMALESMVVMLVLVILIFQIARLTNLLENEVKPILESTNETVSNLRGTTKFLSDNLVEPVIKLNETAAVFKRITDIFRLTKK
jgi:hypothetical protein